ncbi:MAG: glycosyltransferase [Propionibacteriaceae bacterium]|jgi:glycosyltransferase involved in cell wall biosynthesis|nr:glycosyltransferase [Propionibacteriaceae bacterium]
MSGAIVHEWIESIGGSENVLSAMVEVFPDAEIYTLWNNDLVHFPTAHESSLSRTPLRGKKLLSMPAMLGIWPRLKAEKDFDWIVASSHLFAHHAKFIGQSDIPKFVYAHTPARYIWAPEIDRRGRGILPRFVSPFLKKIDKERSSEAVSIAANSEFVRKRIEDSWGRDSVVIYPPVDVEEIQSVSDWSSFVRDEEERSLENLPLEFILGASRFVPYKCLNYVIEAGESIGIPVVLAGSGPEYRELQSLGRRASVPVLVLNKPSNELLRALFQRCTAYIFPPIEDFGIMPVEAMACGAPVIVNSLGGAAESVTICQGGVLVEKWNGETLREAFDRVEKIDTLSSAERATIFSRERFKSNFLHWVSSGLPQPLPLVSSVL